MGSVEFRDVVARDIDALGTLLAGLGMFPPEMVAGLKEMLVAHCVGQLGEGCRWITAEQEGQLVSVACYAPEQFTDGTWNLLLIAIDRRCQGQGLGSQLLQHVEQTLAAAGERLLLIETSGLESFERTRAFYRKHGYEQVGHIPDYYEPGDDKIIFCKAIGVAAEG